MKVAILGARGYLGSNIAEKLSNMGFTVLPVTRQTLNLNNYNQVEDWLGRTEPDCIINCAIEGGTLNVDDFIFEDVQNNIGMFLNFYNSKYNFRYINIGSGAEFDRRYDIDLCSEEDIFRSNPQSSYGYAKNIIARMCLVKPNFYTLRLFGCFDASESEFRLFKKFLTYGTLDLKERYFDFISLDDFISILKFYIEMPNHCLIKDINCVYKDKPKLSEICKLFSKYHVPNGIIHVSGYGNNYTGSSIQLSKLPIVLKGLVNSIKDYI